MYTPVDQRKDLSASGGYTPVGQRTAAPSLAVAPAQNNQIISGVVQAQPNATVIPPGFVGPLRPAAPAPAPQPLPLLQGSPKIGPALQPANTPQSIIQPANVPQAALQPSSSPQNLPSLPKLSVTGVNGTKPPVPIYTWQQENGKLVSGEEYTNNPGQGQIVQEKTPAQQEAERVKFISQSSTGDLLKRQFGDNALTKTVDFLTSPIDPVTRDISDISEANSIKEKVASGQIDSSVYDGIETLHKSGLQIVGDVGQAVLTPYTLEMGGETLAKSALEKSLSELAKMGIKNGAFAGAQFGVTQALSSGSTDPDEITKIILANTAGGAAIGGTLGTAMPALGKVLAEINKAKQNYIKNFIPAAMEKGWTREEAIRLATQGGYAGGIPDKPISSGSGQTGPQLEVPGKVNQLPPLSTAKENVSYEPTLPENTGNVKERGFLTSLKENPKTAETFKDETNNYDQIHNQETMAKAKSLIEQSPEEAQRLAYSNNKTAEVAAVRVALIDKAAAEGDINTARKLGAIAAPEATEAGQFIQAHRMLSGEIDTPAKAIIAAQQELDASNKKLVPAFDDKVNAIEREFKKIHNDAVDKIVGENPELQPPKPKAPVKELPNLEAKVQAKIDRGSQPPADELASRITPYYKTRQPNPIKDMIATLYKLAEEQLPAKGKKPPRDAIELIGQALRDKETYKSTWLQAQDIVRAKWKDNPEALALLDKYFDKTLLSGQTEHAALPVAEKQIGTAVQQEMGKQKVNLGDIVRQHYTVADQTGKDLQAKLIEKANVPAKEAMALSQKIQERFNQLVRDKKDSILKQILGAKATGNKKSFAQSLIELSNLGAFDKPALREQLAQKMGLGTVDDELARNLIAQANVIQKLPYGFEKYKQTQNLLKLVADRMPTDKVAIAGNVLNIFKSLMASEDLSFGLRQGLPAAYAFPKEFASAFKGQFKQVTEKGFEESMDKIMKSPDFGLLEKAGVSFTDVGSTIGKREEAFQSSYAEKLVPGVKLSARAYTGMANQLRYNVGSKLLDMAEAQGGNPRVNSWEAENIAKLTNMLTGRGSLDFGRLGNYEQAAPLLNGIFFSPRLTVSRLDLLTQPLHLLTNPKSYLGAEGFARRQALKALFRFTAGTSIILGAAKLAGANVGTDWTSSDFGKIKVGNTRVDITGSMQQYGRMAGQLITGKYTSSTTGKEYTLGEGYKPMTRLDILGRQFEAKEAPVLSFITDMARGTDLVGNKTTIGGELYQRLVPMVIQDLTDLYKSDPSLLPLGALGIFGAGIQTYAPTPAKPSSKLPSLGKLPGLPKLPKLPK